jgi:hypothetical protein
MTTRDTDAAWTGSCTGPCTSHFTAPVCIVWVAAALPAALCPVIAQATDYLSAADAQKLMFPDATTFAPQPLVSDSGPLRALSERTGGPVNTAFWKISAAMAGDKLLGWVVTDSVIGKFELIGYAVALSPAGEIRDVEILSYREAHGGEVRTPAWRRQFVGKTATAPLAIGNDIANISGATLSCTHLTDGVRRIALYVQLALARS